MLNSFLSMRRDSEQDNGHSSGLDQRKCGFLWVNTVHKVNGTKSQRKWCWHSQKADIQSSDPRVHCPEECLKAKVVENCRYIVAPTLQRLKLFFAQLLLLISSVFTEQSQICVKNVTPAMIEQGRLVVEGQSNPLFVPCVMKDTHTFDRWSCTTRRRSIAQVITTRQID